MYHDTDFFLTIRGTLVLVNPLRTTMPVSSPSGLNHSRSASSLSLSVSTPSIITASLSSIPLVSPLRRFESSRGDIIAAHSDGWWRENNRWFPVIQIAIDRPSVVLRITGHLAARPLLNRLLPVLLRIIGTLILLDNLVTVRSISQRPTASFPKKSKRSLRIAKQLIIPKTVNGLINSKQTNNQ